MMGTGSMWALETETIDAKSYYKIGSATDWKDFAALVNGSESNANAILTADVTISSPENFYSDYVVGKDASHLYSGIFDGKGFTLSFTKDAVLNNVQLSPFGFVSGATIKNLKVTGSLSSSQSAYMGGIVADIYHTAEKTTTIQYCSSALNIKCSAESNMNLGGIVGRIEENATVIIEGCMYTGTIDAANSASGILGYCKSSNVTVRNNLAKCTFKLTSTSATSNSYIYRTSGVSITQSNNYYEITNTNSVNISGTTGTEAQEAQYNSGEMAWYLSGADNSSSSTYFWGQGNLNKSTAEKFPVLTNETAKKVYRIMVIGVSNYPYGNRSGAVPNPVRYGFTAFSTEHEVKYRTTPLTAISSSYNSAVLYGISNIYTLTIGSALVSTLVLPFEAVIPENITAYTLTYTSGDAATATPITTGTIPADTPVLINATAAGNYDFKKKTNDDWEPDATPITWTGATVSNGALTGVYVQNDMSGLYNPTYYVPADSYVLQDGKYGLGFYKVDEDNKIKITSFRAYLTAQTGSSAPRLSIVYNNNTTGINSVREQTNNDDAIYTLNGVRVSRPTKGIYIKNGKKYIVK